MPQQFDLKPLCRLGTRKQYTTCWPIVGHYAVLKSSPTNQNIKITKSLQVNSYNFAINFPLKVRKANLS